MNRIPENDTAVEQEFQDPLENYDPKAYLDPLEKEIAETPSNELKHTPFTTVAPDTTVADAVRLLANQHISCLLVEDCEKLVGVFTHREVLNHVVLEPDVLDRPVGEVMTTDPAHVFQDDPIAATLCVMAVHGYRHVPVLDDEEAIAGIVSPQRMTNFLQQHFEQ